MIIGVATSDKGDVLILGLSRANIERLTSGQPIRVPRGTHSLRGNFEIMIMYGETEQNMALQFQAYGLVTPETKIQADPNLNS